MMALTLARIAEITESHLRGDESQIINGPGSVRSAQPGQITFIAESRYLKCLPDCQASAILLRPRDAETEYVAACPSALLLVEDPYLAWAKLSHHFDKAPTAEPGVDATAWVAPSAVLGKNVSIGPNVVIEADVTLGDGSIIMAGSYVGAGSTLGNDVRLWPNVTIYHGVSIGERTIIHSGAVIGADGFGFAPSAQGWHRIAQVGSVIIGKDVSIGASTCIDRGAVDNTIIGNGVIIDNLVQVGHNVIVGDNTAMAARVGISGSTIIGRNCMLAGKVGISGHLQICDNVTLLGMSMVTRSISRPGVYASGIPSDEQPVWQRNVARFRGLEKLYARVRQLESLVMPHREKNNSAD